MMVLAGVRVKYINWNGPFGILYLLRDGVSRGLFIGATKLGMQFVFTFVFVLFYTFSSDNKGLCEHVNIYFLPNYVLSSYSLLYELVKPSEINSSSFLTRLASNMTLLTNQSENR